MAIAPGPGPTKSEIQNPRAVWILDFGFWILDFGFWILDFGFWILDLFSLRSFCGGPKRPRLDFGFWILDFGFWILDFGFWILDFGFRILDFGLLPIVWILHKIFPNHADSGRRIFTPTWGRFPIDYIFQLGWNHQLEYYSPNRIITASITLPNLAAYLRQTLATRLGSTSNMAWTKNR